MTVQGLTRDTAGLTVITFIEKTLFFYAWVFFPLTATRLLFNLHNNDHNHALTRPAASSLATLVNSVAIDPRDI